jgi:hypothetical protein
VNGASKELGDEGGRTKAITNTEDVETGQELRDEGPHENKIAKTEPKRGLEQKEKTEASGKLFVRVYI